MKKYEITSDDFDNATVILEVDHAVLTPELATLINTFWGESDHRLNDEHGDVVRAVIRLFGLRAIRYFLAQGGVQVPRDKDGYWLKQILVAQHEGWPDAESLGIRLLSAFVDVPDYDDVMLIELV